MGEETINLDKIKKINPTKFIAVCMFVIAIAGMWYCYNWGKNNGSVEICENSKGIPIIHNDIPKCFIRYDLLTKHNNNIGLSEGQIKELEGIYYAKKK